LGDGSLRKKRAPAPKRLKGDSKYEKINNFCDYRNGFLFAVVRVVQNNTSTQSYL